MPFRSYISIKRDGAYDCLKCIAEYKNSNHKTSIILRFENMRKNNVILINFISS